MYMHTYSVLGTVCTCLVRTVLVKVEPADFPSARLGES